MYKVIKNFVDLQDNKYRYKVGDEFPRQGLDVSLTRLTELSGSDNRQHTPLIEEVAEKKSEPKKATRKRGTKKKEV